jgi:phospholipase/carboxylesterase
MERTAARGRAILLALSVCISPVASCNSSDVYDPWNAQIDGFVFPSQHLSTIVRLPEPFDSTKSYTLLVAFHGNGGTGPGFSPVLSNLPRESLLLAVPQGHYAKTTGGYSWFYDTTDRSLWEAYDTESVERVLGLISELKARYRIRNVFVLGFSQGATLAYMVGLRNPGLVRGIAAIGGRMPDIDNTGAIIHAQDIANAQLVKLFVAHGRADNVISIISYADQRDYFLSKQYDVTAYEYDGGHTVTYDVLAQVALWIARYSGT